MVIYPVFEGMIRLAGLLKASVFISKIGIIRYVSKAGHLGGILIDLGYPVI